MVTGVPSAVSVTDVDAVSPLGNVAVTEATPLTVSATAA